MEKVYTRTKGIQPDMVDGFCPGCMHSTLFKLIGEVLEEMDMLDKCTCAIGVGCCGLGMGYFTYDYLLAAHGRACAVATGAKRSNPETLVFTYQGDGDLVLKEMADIFSGLCEKQGFVCRYGGDEYIIVFFTADKERLKETAKQIYQKIDQADGFEKAISEKLKKQISIRKEQRISCSIGIVLAEDIHGEEEINQMIKRADDLLYSIKTTKKGTYRI